MSKTPPVPPAARNPHEQKTGAPEDAENAKVTGHDERTRNLKQQGRQGNIAQNTTNQGYQQDR